MVILLDEESDAFWNEIAYSELEKVTPAEAHRTKERLKGFAQAKEQSSSMKIKDVVKGLQEQFPLYADNVESNKVTESLFMQHGWLWLRRISA